MDYTDIILTFIMLLPFILIITFLIIYFTSLSKFKEKSITLKKINELNEKYNFRDVGSTYYILETYNSLRQLMHSNFDKNIYTYSKNDDHNVKTIMNSVLYNRINIDNYNKDFDSIMKQFDNENSENQLTSIQKMFGRKLCLAKKKKPRLDTSIIIKGIYTSPKGRKSYDATEKYSYDKITSICLHFEEMAELRRSSLDERAKMSDSLRYDVLKRDGFRCRICGATAQDGVKLHVDHIIPISKGGKTEMHNLQTLCEKCNLGKSNKL